MNITAFNKRALSASHLLSLIDPLAEALGFEAGDTNIRRYVGNSPTLLADPTGLAPPDTADPFPAPPRDPDYTPYDGQKAIIDYLNVTIEYRSGTSSSTDCPKSIITIGKDQSKLRQLGHLYHELVSILAYRILGYAESSLLQSGDPFRDAQYPNGKPINVPSTGLHNLALMVEFAALAEFGVSELTPEYVDKRFGTAVCRRPDDKNKDPIQWEKKLKEMVKWMQEAFEGKHDGETFSFKEPPWKAGSLDKERVTIWVYLRADKGRIVDGKVHILLED